MSLYSFASFNLLGVGDRFTNANGAGSEAEVDFVLCYNDKIIPIEVKSGHNVHLHSLHRFEEKGSARYYHQILEQSMSVDEVKTPRGKTFRPANIRLIMPDN